MSGYKGYNIKVTGWCLAYKGYNVNVSKNLYWLPADISEHRLGVAKTMGADHIVHVTTRDAQAVAKLVEEAMGGMPDKTIECSGAEASIQTGIYVSMRNVFFHEVVFL